MNNVDNNDGISLCFVCWLQLLGTLAGFLARKTDFYVGGKDGEWQTVSFHLVLGNLCVWGYAFNSWAFRFLSTLGLSINANPFPPCTQYLFVLVYVVVQMLLGTFEEHATKAKALHQKQQAEKEAEEKKRLEAKRRKEEQLKKETASICEVTDEEADRLQKEIDAKRWVSQADWCCFYFNVHAGIDVWVTFNLYSTASLPESEISKPVGDEADKEDKDTERDKLKPNEGNGCTLEHYKWTQTLGEVEVNFQPFNVHSYPRESN